MKKLLYVGMVDYEGFEAVRTELESIEHIGDIELKGYGRWYYACGRRPEAKAHVEVRVEHWNWNVHDCLKRHGFSFVGEDL